jgi:hypothetical protein
MATESKAKELRQRPRKQRKSDALNKISQTKLKKRVFQRECFADRQLRDVDRLLGRETLRADARAENERALASLKHQLEAARNSNTQDKMRKRYQKVRFIGQNPSLLPQTYSKSERKR